VRTSIFVGTDLDNIRAAARTGADRVELYTGPFAEEFENDPEGAVAPFTAAALAAHSVGLGLNAGHDLNLKNLKFFQQHVPHLSEVSIGHALIADALYLGLEATIKAYKECLK
jgi:pyridoxine 5-phosphate synthase